MKTIIAFLFFILLSPKNYAAEVAKERERGTLRNILLSLSLDKTKFIRTGPTGLEIAQGWKIHVSSAVNLESMQKIMEIVYPILVSEKTGSQAECVPFKYAPFDFLKWLSNSRTQKGKFITIYPESLEQARRVAKKIDASLMAALQTGTLSSRDFDKIPNDAQLGRSGGLFIRYGIISAKVKHLFKIKQNNNPFVTLESHELKMAQTPKTSVDTFFISDDRTLPWGNFINDLKKTDPFPETPLSWTPTETDLRFLKGIIFTWSNTRGKKWENLMWQQQEALRIYGKIPNREDISPFVIEHFFKPFYRRKKNNEGTWFQDANNFKNLLSDPSRVKLHQYATLLEKKVIFQAIMIFDIPLDIESILQRMNDIQSDVYKHFEIIKLVIDMKKLVVNLCSNALSYLENPDSSVQIHSGKKLIKVCESNENCGIEPQKFKNDCVYLKELAQQLHEKPGVDLGTFLDWYFEYAEGAW